MVSANKFDCHSPAPVQKPVQVQGSTSKEYGEDGGAVSRNWGMWQARKEAGTSHVFARPTLFGPFMRVWPHLQHGSLCDS
jgi:hypothetical protein